MSYPRKQIYQLRLQGKWPFPPTDKKHPEMFAAQTISSDSFDLTKKKTKKKHLKDSDLKLIGEALL